MKRKWKWEDFKGKSMRFVDGTIHRVIFAATKSNAFTNDDGYFVAACAPGQTYLGILKHTRRMIVRGGVTCLGCLAASP